MGCNCGRKRGGGTRVEVYLTDTGQVLVRDAKTKTAAEAIQKRYGTKPDGTYRAAIREMK